jgi:sulfide:quinone oxidoreductase
LKETRINHLGKLAFKWIYWNILLKGRPMPWVTNHMSPVGKKLTNEQLRSVKAWQQEISPE